MLFLLARKGFSVSLYEQRSDIRKIKIREGRSINLAVSTRGWTALELLGIDELVREHVVPMRGRMVHSPEGDTSFQPYSAEGDAIFSVSRGRLNQLLLDIAEKCGVKLCFSHKCTYVDLKHGIAYFTVAAEELSEVTIEADLIIGADGAFSAVRKAMQRTDRFNFSQYYIDWGYKELTIPPTPSGEWALEPNALHIWPRGNYMLIALPNLDKSFTCTLFLGFEGDPSFEKLSKPEAVHAFFTTTFPDAVPLMPNLQEEFMENPTSSLVSISCYPWTRYNRSALVGDASHAVVPFYGQGMNAGFEDVRVFMELIEQWGADWSKVLPAYEQLRKPDADAIQELAMANFVEMRDSVADEEFVLRKKIEAELHRRYPRHWLPLYSMVTFSNMRYSDAQERGRQQARIMDEVMARPDIAQSWQELDYEALVKGLPELKS
ncbi:FAD-dependent oxidoreductase [Cesiribacter andamanensis]|uniref:Kynurenine 3-monooxygenase n=1 Tax=Cesiribacter andamanensis AMV16 TaxID=1279009 RepID=M7NGA3_9BACT|nr:NAD(P)/FAD-dependent oxidoreductase [Cesiribacter andamanensis]EMR00845.1 Kynurenine 3-monooxygenase [Cesiribacter andamanensis AMV16]